MSLEPSPKMSELLARLREFVDTRVVPLERAFLAHDYESTKRSIQEVRAEAKAAGFWLPQIAKEHGGMGLSLVDHGHVSEVLGRCLLGHHALNCQAPDAGNMEILLEYGTDRQKKKFLAPLVAGETHSCFSMTEPEHAGSNPTWMSTTAKRDGDTYIINGHKWFTTAADGAAFAIVMAVTDESADTYGRASMIIVPTDTRGFELVKNVSVMGEPGAGWSSHAEIRYTDCCVPVENLLGEEGAGFKIAQQRLGPGRIHHAMRWIGIAERAFELMCQRAMTRQLAPDRPLARQHTILNWVAECRAEIDAARLLVLDTARRIDAEGTKAVRDRVSLIKFFAAGMLGRVLDRAIQVHGALGMTDDTPLAYWFRHERAARIYDGPDEVHKMSAAKHILMRAMGS